MDEEDDIRQTFTLKRQKTSFIHKSMWVDKRVAAIQQQQAIEVLIPYLNIIEQNIMMPDSHHIDTRTKMISPTGVPFYHILSQERSLNYQERLKLTIALLYALKILAERNVIHGAISTETILITKEADNTPVAYIINFTHAKLAEENQYPSHADLYFSAPEILNEHTLSLKSDVYSLGIILALLWGVPNMIIEPNLVKQRTACQTWVPSVNLKHLFYNMSDTRLTNSHQKEIKQIIEGMICIQSKRLPLNKIVQRFEKLDQAIQLKETEISQNPHTNGLFRCFNFFSKYKKESTKKDIEIVELLAATT